MSKLKFIGYGATIIALILFLFMLELLYPQFGISKFVLYISTDFKSAESCVSVCYKAGYDKGECFHPFGYFKETPFGIESTEIKEGVKDLKAIGSCISITRRSFRPIKGNCYCWNI